MTIRVATNDDVEEIKRVARASWNTDYPDILSRETADAGVEEWYASDRLAEELDRSDTVMFVAEVEGEVVGFAHALWNHGEGDILRLYVAPGYRKEGVGTTLLERTVEELFERGVEQVKAMVLAKNELGNRFYRSFGFEPVDEGETTIGGESYPETVYAYEG